MSAFVIDGGRALEGKVDVHGAKNSVLPILAATILGNGRSVIRNCPRLRDVDTSLRILRHLGCDAFREDDTVIVDSAPMNRCDIPDGLMREMRSSVVFLGAILARSGRAVMSFPGGCELGPRPIDLHLSALKALGSSVAEEGGNIYCDAVKPRAAHINLAFPSVGATENIMLMASTIKGEARITNAACEPEIEDLQNFLNAMGARVHGAGTPTVVIEGVSALHPAEHAIIPDRIVASTLLAAVAVAGGDVLLSNVLPEHLLTVIAALSDAGCRIDKGENWLRVSRSGSLKAMRPIRTHPYPGFPTDAQAPVMAAACLAEGTTIFVENIFESRFRHVSELLRMGADIKVEGRVAIVCGVPKLSGAKTDSTDLRGGAALVVAALGAEGESVVSGIQHIDRGYENMEYMLGSIGAGIRRED